MRGGADVVHGALVEELTTLMWSRWAAFSGPDATVDAAQTWHTYTLPAFLSRLAFWIGPQTLPDCRAGNHQPSRLTSKPGRRYRRRARRRSTLDRRRLRPRTMTGDRLDAAAQQLLETQPGIDPYRRARLRQRRLARLPRRRHRGRKLRLPAPIRVHPPRQAPTAPQRAARRHRRPAVDRPMVAAVAVGRRRHRHRRPLCPRGHRRRPRTRRRTQPGRAAASAA